MVKTFVSELLWLASCPRNEDGVPRPNVIPSHHWNENLFLHSPSALGVTHLLAAEGVAKRFRETVALDGLPREGVPYPRNRAAPSPGRVEELGSVAGLIRPIALASFLPGALITPQIFPPR